MHRGEQHTFTAARWQLLSSLVLRGSSASCKAVGEQQLLGRCHQAITVTSKVTDGFLSN